MFPWENRPNKILNPKSDRRNLLSHKKMQSGFERGSLQQNIIKLLNIPFFVQKVLDVEYKIDAGLRGR